ncbi:MAG: hypothetical protein WAV78_12115 [Xanthobacteraceae bacterium]
MLKALARLVRTRVAKECLWSLAFADIPTPRGFLSGQVYVGKRYGKSREKTEVNASIEGDRVSSSHVAFDHCFSLDDRRD